MEETEELRFKFKVDISVIGTRFVKMIAIEVYDQYKTGRSELRITGMKIKDDKIFTIKGELKRRTIGFNQTTKIIKCEGTLNSRTKEIWLKEKK